MSKHTGLLLVILAFLVQSCGLIGSKKSSSGTRRDPQGQLIGIPGGEKWSMPTPYGMVKCPGGSFILGQDDEDAGYTYLNMNKQITIGDFFMDDTEITNSEYRQFIQAMLEDSVDVLGEEYIMTELYPDSTVWKKDFNYSMADPILEYYFTSSAYDQYPVVGVSWEAAQVFCNWRTNLLNEYRASKNLRPMPAFRLPTEAEWEYAARGGRQLSKYPWGGPYIANAKGCYLANFKPGKGDYASDGFLYTSPSKFYPPNDFGIYDMAGNVSEWCQESFYEKYMAEIPDLNPQSPGNSDRKVVRGGSWKDIAYFLQISTRTWEHKDSVRSDLGFRCVMTHVGFTPFKGSK